MKVLLFLLIPLLFQTGSSVPLARRAEGFFAAALHRKAPERVMTEGEFFRLAETIYGLPAPGENGGPRPLTRQKAAEYAAEIVKDACPRDFVRLADGFSDLRLESSEGTRALMRMFCIGIVSPGGEGFFGPEEALSGAEALEILGRVENEGKRGAKVPVPSLPVDGLSAAKSSGQILTVTVKDAARHEAEANYYEKIDGVWRLVFSEVTAVTGEFGVMYDRKQDTRRSPAGDFGIVFAFGNRPNPGISEKLEYRETTPRSYWILDSEHESYNRWTEGNKGVSAEHLQSFGYLYDYALVTDFNYESPVKGDGGAIFIHVMRKDGKGTGGCIGLAEKDLLALMLRLDPDKNPRVIICPEIDLKNF